MIWKLYEPEVALFILAHDGPSIKPAPLRRIGDLAPISEKLYWFRPEWRYTVAPEGSPWTCPCRKPVVHVPSLNHAPAPVARLTSPRKGPDPECQIVFLSISTHTHNPASQGRQPTPGEWLNTKGAGVSRSRKRHASVYSTPEQGGHEPGANSRALDQKPVFLGFSQAEND